MTSAVPAGEMLAHLGVGVLAPAAASRDNGSEMEIRIPDTDDGGGARPSGDKFDALA
jgi:hypothetical protein